ncbi:MAG: glycosyltransferase family 2 protein [Marinagarivorans sp.]|nr:glycosyltransferase family 2 protein [Marinagarivorans sp.]
MTKNKLISILVPMYNEEAVFDSFFNTIEPILKELNEDYEIICVDDGSKDATASLITEKCESDSRVKGLFLSRNFGKEAAMTAAIEHANGDAIIPIDADLQDPPELIPQMINQWLNGYHVVFAKRVSRESDTRIKRNTAGLFYKVFNHLSEMPIPENVGDYRLMDRRVIDEVKRLPEKERFMKGLFCWPGFSNTTIEYERQLRTEGETKFNYWKLWNFALDGITSFSSAPIRLGLYLGILVSGFAFFIWCGNYAKNPINRSRCSWLRIIDGRGIIFRRDTVVFFGALRRVHR